MRWGTGVTYHERTGVEALLILLASEVLDPQLTNLSIVPPKKEAHNQGGYPGHDNCGPLPLVPHVHGRNFLQPRRLGCSVLIPVYGNLNATTQDG